MHVSKLVFFVATLISVCSTAVNAKTITVCGKGGSGCLTTEIRSTKLGEQYRAINGNWRYCRGDCKDTIRKNYLEFWLRHGG